MRSCPGQRSAKKIFSTTLALTTILGTAIISHSAESVNTEEWDITADRIIRYENPNSIVAEGSIILEKRIKLPPRVKKTTPSTSQWADLLDDTAVTKPPITAVEVEEAEAPRYKTEVVIEADWLRYDLESKEIKAKGNVKVAGAGDTLSADSAHIDVDSETGTFNDAVIIRQEDQLHLEGQTIEKTGFNTYHIVDGWAITCQVPNGETPPWSIASKDTRITQGGYAVMKHATFKIKGVPVLYSPYMVIPVKDTRQSGILLPEFSHSSTGGFGINVPYFWAISDSMDATFFPEYYVDRGVMPGVEYRWSYTEKSRGAIMASYLDDDLSDGDMTSSYYKDTDFTHTNSDRYWVRGKADHEFGNWLGRLDVDMVSDRDYLTEFNTGYTGFSETDSRFLDEFGRGFDNKTDDTRQNLLTMLRSWNGMSLQANLLGYNDVRTDEDKDSEEDPLWTLPRVNFSGMLPLDVASLSLSWVNDYVNYWRDDGIGGHRVDLHPSLSMPIPLSPYLESRAEAGLRNTFYIVEEYGDGVWDESSTQNRFLPDFEFEVASPLERTFNLSDGDSFDHSLRPYITYNYIPNVDQDDLPDFDDIDQIDEESTITYGVDNFFDGIFGGSSRDIGYIKLSQSYNFLADEEEFSEINMRLRIKPIPRFALEYETDYDVHGEGFVLHSLLGSYTNSRGDYFSVDYSFNDKGTDRIDQINFTADARLFPNWRTRIEVEHSIEEDETNEATLTLLYTQPCWSVSFQTEYTPSDTRYLMVFNLANIGSPLDVDM